MSKTYTDAINRELIDLREKWDAAERRVAALTRERDALREALRGYYQAHAENMDHIPPCGCLQCAEAERLLAEQPVDKRCVGFAGGCDGDLPSEAHEPHCPRYDSPAETDKPEGVKG